MTNSGSCELRFRRIDALWIAAALAIAAVLHFALAAQSLWLDEIASAKFAEGPVSRLWSVWMRHETNPPLYYTLLAGWQHLAGSSDAALRALSLLFGGLTIVLAYVIALGIAGRRAALFAAVLIACLPEHLHFSQEIRGYGLGQAAALAAIWGFLRFCEGCRNPGEKRFGLTIYVLGCTAALYSHTTLGLLPLILNLFFFAQVLVRRIDRPAVLPWIAANLVVLALWGWWLTIVWWQVNHATNLAWLSRPTLAQAVHGALVAYVPQAWLPIRLAVLAIMGAAAALGAWHLRAKPAFVLPVCALLVPVLLFVISFKSPVLLPRTIYWASAPMWLTVAVGLARLPRSAGWAGFGVLALLALVSTIRTYGHPAGDSWKAVDEAIVAAAPDATIIAGGPHVAFSLERYCSAPRCRFRIHTMTPRTETWTDGMPRPRPITAEQAASIAPADGVIYTVVRYGKEAPYVALAREFEGEDLSKAIGLGDEIRVIRWTRRAETVKSGRAEAAKLESAR
jgi:hypothetical protein